MFVKMTGLYQIDDGKPAYFRKPGVGCFDFVNDKAFASDLTEDEADNVLKHGAWYLKQFNAMKIEKEDEDE